MFLCEGVVPISLGLFSWSWACAGPLQASPAQSLHMKPLLHIYVIPAQQGPVLFLLLLLPPHFPRFLSFFLSFLLF